MTRQLLAVLLFVGILLSACDNFPHSERIGAALASDGETIEIHYVVCGAQRVTEIRLEEKPAGDDGSGSILWQISSDQGSSQEVFDVGSTPVGFQELVPFSGFDSDSELLAVVDTTYGIATLDFAPSDLSTSTIVSFPDGTVEPEAFREKTDRSCESVEGEAR